MCYFGSNWIPRRKIKNVIWECQSVCIVGLSTSMVFFIALVLVSIKSYCRKTAGDHLLWLEITLATPRATRRGVPGRKFRLRVSNLPVTRCLRVFRLSNGFRPKKAPFIFLTLTYNGEVAKLTWPYVTDIKNPRQKIHRYRYRYQSIKV